MTSHYHQFDISYYNMLWHSLLWHISSIGLCEYHDSLPQMSIPWCVITVTCYYCDMSLLIYNRIERCHHAMSIPWHAITITCYIHDMSLLWHVITMACHYRDIILLWHPLPWHIITIHAWAGSETVKGRGREPFQSQSRVDRSRKEGILSKNSHSI